MPRELAQLQPMLLDERRYTAFSDPHWLYEVKYDGHRALAMFGAGQAFVRSRGGMNYTGHFPEVIKALAAVDQGDAPCIVDGELAVLDDLGRSDFERLQARARRRGWYAGCDPVTFCIFDVLQLRGQNVMKLPFVERKALLRGLFTPRPKHSLLVVDAIPEEGLQMYSMAVQLQLEGLVAKHEASTYEPGERSPMWRRIKRPGAVPPERFAHARRRAQEAR